MTTRATGDLPARLKRLRRRFERWRQTCDGRSRIPEGLWASAVKAVSRYGLNPTARALRLDYYSLKKRAEAACREPEPQSRRRGRTTVSGHVSDSQTEARFIELAAPVAGSSVECLLELEDPRGAKMRVHLKGAQVPDLAALSRSFWSVEG